MVRVGRILRPTRFKYALRYFKDPRIKILDIGCGNNSPTLAKLWFPESTYHGADIQQGDLTPEDHKHLDCFFPVTTDYRGYEAIPNDDYDFVIASHIIEHTDDPGRIAAIAASKLKPGGLLWISYPSVRSINAPPGLGITNRFCDDPTHITVVDLIGLCNVLLRHRIKIVKAGPSRDFWRTMMGVAALPPNLWRLATKGGVGKGLWFVFGFEERIIGTKRAA